MISLSMHLDSVSIYMIYNIYDTNIIYSLNQIEYPLLLLILVCFMMVCSRVRKKDGMSYYQRYELLSAQTIRYKITGIL